MVNERRQLEKQVHDKRESSLVMRTYQGPRGNPPLMAVGLRAGTPI